MIALSYRFNASRATLIEGQRPERPCCPVLLRDGTFRRLPWRGFVDIEDFPYRGKRVKLDVRGFSVAVSPIPKWRWLDADIVVLGCVEGNGVYAVVSNGVPVLVPR